MTSSTGTSYRGLGTATGAGLVVANMIGASVFVSAGFMAQVMGPGDILLSWVVGGVLALCGVVAYGALAERIPLSGGEYRYLAELFHPAVGYVAGWGSILLGFAAPVAIDAFVASSYLDTLIPIGDVRVVGTLFILLLTALHAVRLDVSAWAQNALVIVKLGLVVAFAVFGVVIGAHAVPSWSPPTQDATPFTTFLENQFWVAFAFSGWNAAIYAASEFRDPKRQVPRAMALGALLVTVLYLVVNWVFVANLTPLDAAAVQEEKTLVTLGHIVVGRLAGPGAAGAMSAVAVIAFLSAMSAMTMVGARVTAAMADDGLLPAVLGERRPRPPVGALAFQAVIACTLLWTTSLHHIVQSAAAVLMLFTALTVLGLFRVTRARPNLAPPGIPALIAAAVYAVASFGFLFYGFRDNPELLLGLAGCGAFGVLAWALTPQRVTADASAKG